MVVSSWVIDRVAIPPRLSWRLLQALVRGAEDGVLTLGGCLRNRSEASVGSCAGCGRCARSARATMNGQVVSAEDVTRSARPRTLPSWVSTTT